MIVVNFQYHIFGFATFIIGNFDLLFVLLSIDDIDLVSDNSKTEF